MHPLHTLTRRLAVALGRIRRRRCRCPRPRRWPRRRKATSICGSRIRSRSKPERRSRSSSSFPTAARIAANSSPILQGWLKTMPPDVQFRRIPVMFQDRWIPLAKIYYTLEALGEESRLSPDVFVALHGKGLPLWQDKTFFDWAASQGLDRKKVEDMYNSFGIGGKVNRARMVGAGLPGPVGPVDRRRRQVRQQSRAVARRDAAADRRAGRQGARRATEELIRAAVASSAHGTTRPRTTGPCGIAWCASAQRLHHRRQQRPRRGAGAAIRRRRVPASDCSRAAAPSSTRSPPTLPAGRVAVYAGDVRDADALAAPPPISSRVSACPTSSSPTPESRRAC